MRLTKTIKKLLLIAVAASPATALACGEMMFNAGRGLPFQSYLAPRPADVLVLWTDASQDDYYAALQRAGHHITLVADAEDMAAQLRQNQFDIIIADFDALSAVPEQVANDSAPGPRLLPIVARSLRKSPQVRDRFEQFLIEGASIGQYLTIINRVLDSVT
ncbi:MAG: hypothetical protein PVF50_08675 [Gammaproteobacteria bacterium]|jgi:hypothetical protein